MLCRESVAAGSFCYCYLSILLNIPQRTSAFIKISLNLLLQLCDLSVKLGELLLEFRNLSFTLLK